MKFSPILKARAGSRFQQALFSKVRTVVEQGIQNYTTGILEKYTDHKRVIKLYDMLMLLMHLGMRKHQPALMKEHGGKHGVKELQTCMKNCK